MRKNLFIAVEGIDGSGKNTQLKKVGAYLEKLGYVVRFSKEPNDSDDTPSVLGRTIKKMLQGKIRKTENPVEFQRIYILERGQNCICYITPFFQEMNDLGKIAAAATERFSDSTIAYGMLSGKPIEFFIRMHKKIIGKHMIWPTVTILIDISAEEAIRRIKIRNRKKKEKSEYFEKMEFLKKIRENYLAITKHPFFKNNHIVINGEQSEKAVFEEIKQALQPFLF